MRDIILAFSGGKDSLACLHMMKPDWDRILVVWCDTGASFPHIAQFIAETCKNLDLPLEVIRPPEPIRSYHARMGVPADIVPVWNSAEAALLIENRPLLNPSLRCCWDMRWDPIRRFIADYKPRFVVRGSKKSDRVVGFGDGYVDENGIGYICPVWGKTDEDVYGYLGSIGVDLPSHYGDVADGLDCSCCSAFLTVEPAKQRIAYTKAEYPELWPELSRNLETVRSVLADEFRAVRSILDLDEGSSE